jgi:hypothetical protein
LLLHFSRIVKLPKIIRQSNFIKEIIYRENSRSDIAMLVSKIVSTFLFSFFSSSADYQWFLIISLFGLSVMQFMKVFTSKPYYHFSSLVIMIITNGLYMWTNFILLLAKVNSNNFSFRSSNRIISLVLSIFG